MLGPVQAREGLSLTPRAPLATAWPTREVTVAGNTQMTPGPLDDVIFSE